MTLETALNEHSIDKEEVYSRWISRAVEDPRALEEVLEKAFGGNERERKRGNWILHHVSDRKPEVFRPYFGRMRGQLSLAQTEAELRFVLRYFSKYELPEAEDFEAFMLDYCFEKLLEPGKSRAPRIYSMSILYRLVLRYPELAKELDDSIEMALNGANPGLKSRAKHVRAGLRKNGLI